MLFSEDQGTHVLPFQHSTSLFLVCLCRHGIRQKGYSLEDGQ